MNNCILGYIKQKYLKLIKGERRIIIVKADVAEYFLYAVQAEIIRKELDRTVFN